MSSSGDGGVRLVAGNLLNSRAQTLVNTVNCVGVMGKGIALEFKKRYPEMYDDYVARCDRREVRLGEPYLFKGEDRWILNFPTKDHWRAVSRLEDIVAGMRYLQDHYRDWGITSLAVPPLGCGNGQLEWSVVGPTLMRHLSQLDVPVELYPPKGEPTDGEQLRLLPDESDVGTVAKHVSPEWVAIVAILDRLERRQYHWPVGRVMLQKLAYFATQAGIPTGLKFEADSYGPYSPDIKRHVGRLQNNGLAFERKSGQMFEVRVGPTYTDAVDSFRDRMEPWRAAVDRTEDLMSRMNTGSAEVAATVHFSAHRLRDDLGRTPTASEVIEAVEAWKVKRRPPVTRQSIVEAILLLGTRGWIEVEPDDETTDLFEDLVTG